MKSKEHENKKGMIKIKRKEQGPEIINNKKKKRINKMKKAINWAAN